MPTRLLYHVCTLSLKSSAPPIHFLPQWLAMTMLALWLNTKLNVIPYLFMIFVFVLVFEGLAQEHVKDVHPNMC